MRIRFFLLIFITQGVYAQTPQVPSRMEFADLKLRIMEDARREIQEDVDAYTKSPKYFNIKVERARAYFPIIERIFREEAVPDDFKYLVLQESALIPDAVSSSNAVGYWQFKDFTAMEVGLRVDHHIDERMNIVSATRGAARYFKKNNAYFDNWLYALQAYQMGAGGALKVWDKQDKGKKSMVIDKRTYWYVKKFLAHKIAYEHVVGQPGELKLLEYTEGSNKNMRDISHETQVPENQLLAYNMWLKKGKIPDDRSYTVILPVSKLSNIQVPGSDHSPTLSAEKVVAYEFDEMSLYPDIEDVKKAKEGEIVKINGINALMGMEGDKVMSLVSKSGVDLRKFLKNNDLEVNEPVVAGQVYYLKSKRNKAKTHYYPIQPGETLWDVSQKFGIKLKKLKVKNRIVEHETVKPGRVLWLRYIRPADVPIAYEEIKVKSTLPIPVVKKEIIEIESELKKEKKPLDTVQYEVIKGEENAVKIPTIFPTKNTIHKVHIVKPGETLYAISKEYNITVLELMEWNSLTITDKLSVDQKLNIYQSPQPVAEEALPQKKAEEVWRYYIVKEGDTLYSISRYYDVTIEEIMQWNDKSDYAVKLGENIRIRRKN